MQGQNLVVFMHIFVLKQLMFQSLWCRLEDESCLNEIPKYLSAFWKFWVQLRLSFLDQVEGWLDMHLTIQGWNTLLVQVSLVVSVDRKTANWKCCIYLMKIGSVTQHCKKIDGCLEIWYRNSNCRPTSVYITTIMRKQNLAWVIKINDNISEEFLKH